VCGFRVFSGFLFVFSCVFIRGCLTPLGLREIVFSVFFVEGGTDRLD